MKPLPNPPSRQAQRRIEPLSVLPVFFTLEARRAVVIGGSAASAWKAELLAAAGAHIDIYAPRPGQEMLTFASNGGAVRLIPGNWSAKALAGAALIVADAESRAEAMDISTAARALGVPANLIDRPEFCDFQFGAIVNRSPLVIGISTSGAAPVLAQEIRSRIECILPPRIASWVRIATRIRDKVSRRFSSAAERRRYWSGFTARAMQRRRPSPDRVTIIRAEAVEDLTIREVRALQSADVIHVGNGCPQGILDFARREAMRVAHAAVETAGDRNVVVIQAVGCT
jgi:uroporphyrin-III C-methyltransferase/precorrin-2 dehydrogenase/sirohydrochlorin ferrochelatase